jgi:AcrR family transcriptional regulator
LIGDHFGRAAQGGCIQLPLLRHVGPAIRYPIRCICRGAIHPSGALIRRRSGQKITHSICHGHLGEILAAVNSNSTVKSNIFDNATGVVEQDSLRNRTVIPPMRGYGDAMRNADAYAPRVPQRARGKARFELLLDVVDALLAERDATEISLNTVAERAATPLASVYHYFPSSIALLVGLAQRYQHKFAELMAEPIDHRVISGWTDICRHHLERGRAFYHAHPVALRLLLGSDCAWQVRQADMAWNHGLGELQYRSYHRHFMIPSDPALIERFSLAISMTDAIWSYSFSRHQRIIDPLAEEAARAKIAYLSLYLPRHANKRPVPLPAEVPGPATHG